MTESGSSSGTGAAKLCTTTTARGISTSTAISDAVATAVPTATTTVPTASAVLPTAVPTSATYRTSDGGNSSSKLSAATAAGSTSCATAKLCGGATSGSKCGASQPSAARDDLHAASSCATSCSDGNSCSLFCHDSWRTGVFHSSTRLCYHSNATNERENAAGAIPKFGADGAAGFYSTAEAGG